MSLGILHTSLGKVTSYLVAIFMINNYVLEMCLKKILEKSGIIRNIKILERVWQSPEDLGYAKLVGGKKNSLKINLNL